MMISVKRSFVTSMFMVMLAATMAGCGFLGQARRCASPAGRVVSPGLSRTGSSMVRVGKAPASRRDNIAWAPRSPMASAGEVIVVSSGEA